MPRVLLAVGAPVALVAVSVRALFPEGGYEPYPATSFAATTSWCAGSCGRLPRGERNRVLRVGAVVYLLACLLCVVVRTPMGSNIERYGVLLAGPLLLCALAGDRTRAHARQGGRRRLSRRRSAYAQPVAVGVAVCVAMAWSVWGPVRETSGGRRDRRRRGPPITRRSSATWPRTAAGSERVEVPLTRSHWEAAMLAPSVSLARGWEKQLEERYDSALLGSGLTPRGIGRG